jgi:acetyl esterase/lipase
MPRKFIMIAAGLATIGAAPPQQQPAQKPAAAVPAASPAPLAVEAFADMPQMEGPALSPDGTRIAAKIAIRGTQYFSISTIGAAGAPQLLGAGKADVNWWRWVNRDWVVIGIGQTVPVDGDEWYATRAIGYHVPTGKVIQLAPRDAGQTGDDLIWTARDGSARVMLAFQTSIFTDTAGFWPKVEEIDLDTGKRRTILSGLTGVMDWYADSAGVVRMGIGFSEDGRSRRIHYRDTNEQLFRTIDRTRKGDDRLIVPALFLEDKSRALVIDDDADGYSALYELDLRTLERGKQLFASKGYDIGGLIPDAGGSKLLGVAVHENAAAVHWIDPDMQAMQASVSGLVKGAKVEIVSTSSDRSRAIIAVGGADAPGGYFLFERATTTVMPLAYTNPSIKLKRMHPVRTIRYKARDGVEIAAVLTTPRGRTGKLPLIVMPHGGPRARDSETWDWWPQFLADRGYLVVQPNYRGSTGYGTRFMELGEGQWGLAMQDDLDDSVRALAELGLADPARVCMVGASYGGYAALRAAQRDSDKYRCAVSYAGVSDLNRMLRHQRNFLYAGARSDWLRRQASDLKSVSPVNFPESVKIPVLLMHGEEDRVVPIVQSRVIAQKLKSAGKDVTYIVQPLADHHFSRQEDRLEFLKALEAFLAKHNPA